MAGISARDQILFGRRDNPSAQFGQLSSRFDDLLSYLKGDDIGGVSGSPIQLGRSVIKDVKKGEKLYRREELPDLFGRYVRDVGSGQLSPAEASAAYEAAARGAGQIKGTIRKAEKLARLTPGAPSEDLYARYTPFFQGTGQAMLGRTFSEPEIKNYVSTLRGMGIKDPGDVSAAFGKLLTTSDEYRTRQYRFKPTGPTPDTSAFQQFSDMLNASIGQNNNIQVENHGKKI